MNNIKNEIKRFSFCGFSHNLIELFLIVGYDHSFINNEVPKLIEKEKKDFEILEVKMNEKDLGKSFNAQTNPSILSVISSDYKEEMMSLNNLINFLFPSFPTFYYSSDNESNQIVNNSFNNFIFQNNSTIDNLKVCFNGYCYNFYEQINIKHLNKKLYAPKCFVILSQYQLFGLFNKLCKEIHSQFSIPEIEIPIEIQIYNILNFVPAPIFSKLSLSLFCYYTLQEYSSKKNELELLNLPNQKKIEINQISGYPFFDLSISRILTLLPFEEIIEIFLLVFLEKQVNVFYSSLELLNIFMLVLTSFNFPFDTMYNWQIVSVGYNELKNIEGSMLIGKPNTSILGFNMKYEEKLLKISPNKTCINVDLENDFINYINYNEQDKQFSELSEYLRNIFKNNKSNGKIGKYIMTIGAKIKELYDKFILSELHSDFFVPDENLNNTNKFIQNVFFEFYVNIFALIYPLIKLKRLDSPNSDGKYFEYDKSKIEKTSFDVELDLSELNLEEEEKSFINIFFESLKFDSFINYIIDNSYIEMLQTIYIIIDELIILKNINDQPIDYIELIDTLYITNDKIEQINFYNFYLYYQKNLQQFFGQEINSEHIEKKIDNTKKKYSYKYKKIDFDSSIIFKYMHLINQLKPEELERIFPSLKIKNSPPYKVINENEIVDCIENYLIKNKKLKIHEYIIMTTINIFILFIELYDIDIFKNEIKNLLQLLNVSFRKYIYRIIYVYYNLCQKQLKNKNYSLLSKAFAFIEIFEFLSTKNILPNKSLLNLIEEILSLYYREEENIKNYEYNYQNIYNEDINKLYNLNIKVNKINIPKKKTKENFIIEVAQAFNTDIENEQYIYKDNISITFNTLLSNIKKKEIMTIIYSPFHLLNLSDSIYNNFIEDFTNHILDNNNYNEMIVNILFYFQNCKQIPNETQIILKVLFKSLFG